MLALINIFKAIKPTDFPNDLKTFGWSVRGETDFDSNGYPGLDIHF